MWSLTDLPSTCLLWCFLPKKERISTTRSSVRSWYYLSNNLRAGYVVKWDESNVSQWTQAVACRTIAMLAFRCGKKGGLHLSCIGRPMSWSKVATFWFITEPVGLRISLCHVLFPTISVDLNYGHVFITLELQALKVSRGLPDEWESLRFSSRIHDVFKSPTRTPGKFEGPRRQAVETLGYNMRLSNILRKQKLIEALSVVTFRPSGMSLGWYADSMKSFQATNKKYPGSDLWSRGP